MTLYKPTLEVSRLVAVKNNKIVFNEKFHTGLNVLFGANGGGKTSVIQLLVHGLGYEVKKWKQEAGSCDFVFVEVKLNGAIVSLRRKVGGEKQGIDICFSAFDEAFKTGVEGWFSYPYSVTSKESFSQKIFSLLEVPEVRSDSTNITLHQIMRLMYNDQSNPASSIFNYEQFDSAVKREAIGNYLLGLYDNGLYAKKLELIEKDKILTSIISESKAIYAVVGKSGLMDGLSNIDELGKSYSDELDVLRGRAISIKRDGAAEYKLEKSTIKESTTNVVDLKVQLSNFEHDISVISYEIEDSKSFIRELEDKFRSVSDSLLVSASAPSVIFDICPSCYAKISSKGHDACSLCGKDATEDQKNTNLLRMKNEMHIQLSESKRLLERKIGELVELNLKKRKLYSLLRSMVNQTVVSVFSSNSAVEKESFEVYRKIGEVEEKIVLLEKMKDLYSELARLAKQRDELQISVNQLKEDIYKLEQAYAVRIPLVKQKISELVCSILKKDIASEEEFISAEVVEYDFDANSVAVNGKSYFSESSMFLLNNAFHLALLKYSTLDKNVRLPRFMILDGIENGGMQENRSKNFQKIVRDFMADSEVDYQIIIATKNAAEELRTEEYLFGRHFTKDEKSLLI